MSWQQITISIYLVVRVAMAICSYIKSDREIAIMNFAGTVLIYAALKTGGFWG